MKWAIIYALMTLLWMLAERLLGLHDAYIAKHATYTGLIFLPIILIYFLALADKRKNVYEGTMTYKQGIISGLTFTAIITLLAPITQMITSTVITPSYFANATEYALATGQMTQTAAEAYFNLKNYIVQGLIGTLIMGLIISSIVAIFTRSRETKNS